MIIERVITLQTPAKDKEERVVTWYKNPAFFKFILLIFLQIIVNFYIFIFLSTGGTAKYVCKVFTGDTNNCYYYKVNGWILMFYLLYSLYFWLSSYQIK